ncbi:MAG: IclR family transcriptional regulator [Desulfobacterales bacterium]|nr:IclR family transcriptional regulator [Desulfobacterales bacterium]
MAKTIQSLERGLRILNIIGKSHTPMSLNDIAAHFSIDRSSVFRLISTLVQNDYVFQDAANKTYTLGYGVMKLSEAASRFSPVESLIRPVMRQVAEKTGQNTHLAVLEGDEVVFLAVEQPKHHLSLNICEGVREPALYTALGRSLLAFAGPEKTAGVIQRTGLQSYTENSIRSVPELEAAMASVRKDYLAVDNEEYRSGIVCIAAPVFDRAGMARYSFGISGLKAVIHPEVDVYKKIIRHAGEKASSLLQLPESPSENSVSPN